MRLFEIMRGPMYVVGDPGTYDPLLAKKRLVKAGKDFEPGYPGGSVYFSISAAIKASRRCGYGVYRLRYPYRPEHVYQAEDGYHLSHGMAVVKRVR